MCGAVVVVRHEEVRRFASGEFDLLQMLFLHEKMSITRSQYHIASYFQHHHVLPPGNVQNDDPMMRASRSISSKPIKKEGNNKGNNNAGRRRKPRETNKKIKLSRTGQTPLCVALCSSVRHCFSCTFFSFRVNSRESRCLLSISSLHNKPQ